MFQFSRFGESLYQLYGHPLAIVVGLEVKFLGPPSTLLSLNKTYSSIMGFLNFGLYLVDKGLPMTLCTHSSHGTCFGPMCAIGFFVLAP